VPVMAPSAPCAGELVVANDMVPLSFDTPERSKMTIVSYAVVVATSCAVGIVVSAVIADTDTPAEIPRVITTSNNAFRYERHIQK
jgi:hypothetical protein